MTVSALVLFLSNYVKIHRFDALSLQWWFSIVYIAVFSAYIVILDFTDGDAIKYTQYVLVGGMSITSAFFMVGELTTAVGIKVKVWKVNVGDILGLIITTGLVLWRIESGNTWYINNIFGNVCC